MRCSLDALQDFYQLCLLVWSHAGKHTGSQHELQCPHVERQRITGTSSQHEANTEINLNVTYLSSYLLD